MKMQFQTLQQLLEERSQNAIPSKIISYPRGSTRTSKVITYKDVLEESRLRSSLIRNLDGFKSRSVVLIHLNDQLSAIIWFWSVLYAGGIPAMSTPFSNDPNHRVLHIEHLCKLFNHPLCFTSESTLDQFSGQRFLKPITIESFDTASVTDQLDTLPQQISFEDTTLLMLTSGSTGNSKAVCLSHQQILAAVAGKSSVLALPMDGSFLNWIGLDHVASMVEIHLQALFIDVDQVHVHAADIVNDPLQFIDLIHKHRVSRTFAPNFFLARLGSALEQEQRDKRHEWDLSCLRYIASGGEANVTKTCATITSLLTHYGAPPKTIVTGFGMTETCAGAIFNTNCPAYDIENGLEFASVGTCMPGLDMRVVSSNSQENSCVNEVGELQVRGPVVFKKYFNNIAATEEAFTRDGWFKTGDQALVDQAGYLNITGRLKDTLIVNGVKYSPEEIESAIEDARIPGIASSYTVCFSSLRPDSSPTEEVYVAYLPTYSVGDHVAHMEILNSISRVVLIQTGAQPRILPLDENILHKSTLGKLSRAKIKQAFERGDYRLYEIINKERIAGYKNLYNEKPANSMEELLMGVFVDTLSLHDQNFDVVSPIFQMGITSIDLIRLKRKIEEHLNLSSPIPIITLMTNPTIRSLVVALQNSSGTANYAPIVTIQPQGTEIPLWIIHPGVGEVLVFLNLAKYFPDRPIYALRARGFNKGEPYFADIGDAVTTYYAAIKNKQPQGPYAIAGYSYGSMLAFESAKILEKNGDEVKFLGVFNLPPHIKSRMKQLDWTECILHLSYFLDLITESHSRNLATELHTSPREEVLANVLTSANPDRLSELSLTPVALVNWANLAYALQSMAVEYEPLGLVAQMDVFYCTPLAVVAATKEEWLSEHLNHWREFVKSEVRFHEVGGEHYTMLGKEHVFSFQKTLRRALTARGM